MHMRTGALVLAAAVLAWTACPVAAQTKVTPPKAFFGFDLGDDYHVASYRQISEYWKRLDRESDRMVLQEIGKTAEGRPQYMAIVTSPQNHRRLARYKDIARRLALAEGLSDDQARALAAEGKAVVWIDGGLHATETVGSQQLAATVYMLVSRTDPETLRFLDDVIVLCAHANPDGNDLVADWYMREPVPEKRSLANVPRLYQKYIGHDNNRDFYIANQPETENINRVLYHEWFPQIVYNHHQTGPAGTVLFAPPFRGPHNYNYDPLVPLGIDLVAAAMHNRFAVEGKAGATRNRGANYSTWYNGGLRTTTYFHNMIGLLTEIIGSPNPIEIPFRPERQIASEDLPFPIAPQRWHYRQSIEYSLTANRAVLDVASRFREQFLFNIYRMGRNSIERGSRDSWTTWPGRIDAVNDAVAREQGGQRDSTPAVAQIGGGIRTPAAPLKYFDSILRDPALRDPRGYILPSNQPDFPTATKFVNALIKAGVTVHRATGDFQVQGKQYPVGSLVVKTAQAFRPHVLDMFEPQDHPNDIPYPGGPPIPPYDNAGYTLAMTMGVVYDRVLEGFDGPFEKLTGFATPPVVAAPPQSPAGYFVDRRSNDAVIAVNRVLKHGGEVFTLPEATDVAGTRYDAWTFFVAEGPGTHAIVASAARDLGVRITPAAARPASLTRVHPARIALWDRYGGSMPSGWIRWMLERFEFPFEVVYPPALDAGDLRTRFDVIVFPDGAIPDRDGSGGFGDAQPGAESIPAEYRSWLGRVTVSGTVPKLREFLAAGGTVFTLGRSTSLARHLGLPIEDALAERQPDGTLKPLPREKFYIPGSVLRAAVDTTHSLAAGLPALVDLFFDESPSFRLGPDAAAKGVTPVAWFSTPRPLRSGWAWGQHHLDGAVAIAEARVGNGRLVLSGPEVTMRAQTHGTFKFLFNGLYVAEVTAARQ
jgi:hypothetical protein